MKVLKSIKKFVLGFLGVLFFAFALSITILLLNYNNYGVTQFGDTSLIIIRESISSEEYKKGDLVLVKAVSLDKISVGDKVFAYRVDEKKVAHVDLGTVGKVNLSEKSISYENGSSFTTDYIIGKSSKIYNNIGLYLSIIQSKWGFLFIVLVPGFLIFLYQVYALIIEIKYGSEQD